MDFMALWPLEPALTAAFRGTISAASTRQTIFDSTRSLVSCAVPTKPLPPPHAMLAQLKAGESEFPTFLLAKTVFHALKGAQPLLHALFWRQNTVWDTSRPAFKETVLLG